MEGSAKFSKGKFAETPAPDFASPNSGSVPTSSEDPITLHANMQREEPPVFESAAQDEDSQSPFDQISVPVTSRISTVSA